MANETTTTTLATVTPTESIPSAIDGYRFAPDLSGVIARVRNVPRGTGGVYRWPRHGVVAPNAGVKTEATAAFANVAFTPAEATSTAGVVGMSIWISREAQQDATISSPAEELKEAVRSMRNRLTSDMLSLITGATNSYGAVTDEMDIGHIGAGLARWETLNPAEGELCVIMAPFQWGDLLMDMTSNASGASAVIAAGVDMFRGVAGYKGKILGANIFTHSGVATETTGRNAVITMAGEQSGLGVAVWQPIQQEPVPGNAAPYYSDQYLVHARYGATLVANGSAPDASVLELISRAS